MHVISATVRAASDMMDEGYTACTVENLLPRVYAYIAYDQLAREEVARQVRAAADRFLGTVPGRPGFYSLTL